jgi:hypothetical protein
LIAHQASPTFKVKDSPFDALLSKRGVIHKKESESLYVGNNFLANRRPEESLSNSGPDAPSPLTNS